MNSYACAYMNEKQVYSGRLLRFSDAWVSRITYNIIDGHCIYIYIPRAKGYPLTVQQVQYSFGLYFLTPYYVRVYWYSY